LKNFAPQGKNQNQNLIIKPTMGTTEENEQITEAQAIAVYTTSLNLD